MTREELAAFIRERLAVRDAARDATSVPHARQRHDTSFLAAVLAGGDQYAAHVAERAARPPARFGAL